jgi:hypothetical protein
MVGKLVADLLFTLTNQKPTQTPALNGSGVGVHVHGKRRGRPVRSITTTLSSSDSVSPGEGG